MYRSYLYTYNIHRIYVFIYIYIFIVTRSDTHTYTPPGGARPPRSLTQPQQKVLGSAGSGEVLCFLLQKQNKTKRPYSLCVSFRSPKTLKKNPSPNILNFFPRGFSSVLPRPQWRIQACPCGLGRSLREIQVGQRVPACPQ